MKTRFDKKVTIDGYHVIKYLIIAERFYFVFWGNSAYRPTFIVRHHQGARQNFRYFGIRSRGYDEAFEAARNFAVECALLSEDKAAKLQAPSIATILKYREYYMKNFGQLVPRSDIHEMFGLPIYDEFYTTKRRLELRTK